MDIGATELLGAHFFPGRRLHQRRAGQKYGAFAAHDDALVGHGRHVGAASGARAHDHGDLGDAARQHVRLVVEDPPEVLAIRKHLVLVGQIGATGIHKVDTGQAVRLGDLLFCSGQIALDPRSGELVGSTTPEQAEQALANLAAVLEAGGSSMGMVVRTTVFLADMADFAAVNELLGFLTENCCSGVAGCGTPGSESA